MAVAFGSGELHLAVLHVMLVMHGMMMPVMTVHMIMHVVHIRRWLGRRTVRVQRIPNEVMGVLVEIVGGEDHIGLRRKHSSKHYCNQKRSLTHVNLQPVSIHRVPRQGRMMHDKAKL